MPLSSNASSVVNQLCIIWFKLYYTNQETGYKTNYLDKFIRNNLWFHFQVFACINEWSSRRAA
jgi:hypothetical protein